MVASIAFSPRGDLLVTGGYDGLVFFWDVATGKKLGNLRYAGFVYHVEFDREGSRLVIAVGDGTVRVVEPSSRREILLLKAPKPRVSWAGFSPDGNDLAVAAEDSLTTWDVATSQPLLRLLDLKSDVLSLAYSPDGRRLAAGSSDRTVTLRDAGTGRKVASRDDAIGRVALVRFAPDGKTLAATAGDETVLIWDLGDLGPSAPPPP